jgi:hypothetical protein
LTGRVNSVPLGVLENGGRCAKESDSRLDDIPDRKSAPRQRGRVAFLRAAPVNAG